jgi:hypothetical protein
MLDVGDRRTTKMLSDRAGVQLDSGAGEMTLERFVTAQRFIHHGNPALRALLARLSNSRSHKL